MQCFYCETVGKNDEDDVEDFVGLRSSWNAGQCTPTILAETCTMLLASCANMLPKVLHISFSFCCMSLQVVDLWGDECTLLAIETSAKLS